MLARASAALALVLMGCTTPGELSPVYQRVGAERDEGLLKVSYLACPGEQLQEVTLWELDDDNLAGEDGDTVLWSASEQELSKLLDGSSVSPSGALGPLLFAPDERYYLEAYSTQGSGDTSAFRLADVGSGEIRVDARTVTFEEFRANARDTCE